MDYYICGDRLEFYHFSAETKKHRQAEGRTAVNLGWVATELNQQGSVLSFTKRLRACVKAGGWTVEHFEHIV